MSSADQLHVVRVGVGSDLIDTITGALALVGVAFSHWENRETGDSRFDVFFDTPEEAAKLEAVLREQLTQFATNSWNIELTAIENKNWQESWKDYFHVERVSERIVTKPSWEDYSPEAGDCVIEIDPGMSFGTGQHATTRGCLRFLDSLSRESEPGGFLDLGCGSGILSIAAAKLGYSPITAVDIDPDAVAVAGENLASNGVDDRVTTGVADVSTWTAESPYSVVAANILAPVLLANADRIAAAVKRPGGHLLLAGILTSQYPEVRAAYTALGFTEIGSATEAEWTSGCFRASPIR
jgi:ribosomal protein L11 methyltransferase